MRDQTGQTDQGENRFGSVKQTAGEKCFVELKISLDDSKGQRQNDDFRQPEDFQQCPNGNVRLEIRDERSEVEVAIEMNMFVDETIANEMNERSKVEDQRFREMNECPEGIISSKDERGAV